VSTSEFRAACSVESLVLKDVQTVGIHSLLRYLEASQMMISFCCLLLEVMMNRTHPSMCILIKDDCGRVTSPVMFCGVYTALRRDPGSLGVVSVDLTVRIRRAYRKCWYYAE